MTHTDDAHAEFAREAGLLEQDMPPADHPLFQNNAEVRTLADLIEARTEQPPLEVDEAENTRTRSADFTGDDEYMGREDFVEEMGMADPDPDAEADDADFIEGAEHDRSVDITGTATGIARGMATHLPQDIGAGGFQIEEPEMSGDPRTGVGDKDFGADNSFQDKDGNLRERSQDDKAVHDMRGKSNYEPFTLASEGVNEAANVTIANDETDEDLILPEEVTNADNTDNAGSHHRQSSDDELDGTRRIQ